MAWCLSCDKRHKRMHSNRYTLKDLHDRRGLGNETKSTNFYDQRMSMPDFLVLRDIRNIRNKSFDI